MTSLRDASVQALLCVGVSMRQLWRRNKIYAHKHERYSTLFLTTICGFNDRILSPADFFLCMRSSIPISQFRPDIGLKSAISTVKSLSTMTLTHSLSPPGYHAYTLKWWNCSTRDYEQASRPEENQWHVLLTTRLAGLFILKPHWENAYGVLFAVMFL